MNLLALLVFCEHVSASRIDIGGVHIHRITVSERGLTGCVILSSPLYHLGLSSDCLTLPTTSLSFICMLYLWPFPGSGDLKTYSICLCRSVQVEHPDASRSPLLAGEHEKAALVRHDTYYLSSRSLLSVRRHCRHISHSVPTHILRILLMTPCPRQLPHPYYLLPDNAYKSCICKARLHPLNCWN